MSRTLSKQSEKKPQIRLVGIQGTMELLHVLAILHHQSSTIDDNVYHDYLIIHGVGLKKEYEKNILSAINEMAKCWNWHAIINAHGIENMSPGQEVYHLVGTDHADVVISVRNWQKSDEVLMSSYKNAKFIAYGDAFGFYDCHVGDGFVKIDEAHMMLPIEWVKNSLESVPITVIPKQTVISVIDKCIQHSNMLVEYCTLINKKINSDKVLVLLANISEIELMSFQDAVDTYVSLIVENARAEDAIYIKPHPREMNGQSAVIQEVLVSKFGFTQVYILGNDVLSKLPVELYCRIFSFQKILTMLSTSAVSLSYLYDIIPVMGLNESGYNKLTREKAYYKKCVAILREIIERLSAWDGKSIIYSFNFTSPAYQAALIGDGRYKQAADEIINNILNNNPDKKIVLFGANNISRYMLQNDDFANRVDFVVDSFKQGIINGKQVYPREVLKKAHGYFLIINVVKQAQEVLDTLHRENLALNLDIIRLDDELAKEL